VFIRVHLWLKRFLLQFKELDREGGIMSEVSNDREYRRRALAKIHIAKKELGLSDADYRDVVRSAVPGKESAADLTDDELRMLLDRLAELGWRPRLPRVVERPMPPMVWQARELWLRLHRQGKVHHPSWAALGRFAKRMTGVADLRRLSVKQATVVIEALKQWLERVE
jgi:phage gp16-like protein